MENKVCYPKLLSLAVGFSFALVGCGSGSNSSGSEVLPGGGSQSEQTLPPPQTGRFIDSPVANIDYSTETLSGTTNPNGEFLYREGENVTFAIGDMAFPSVAAGPLITPLDMSASGQIDETVTNIIRILQSLDTDGNPENGITISDEARFGATQVVFAQSVASFAESTAIMALLPNAGLNFVRAGLIPIIEAISHLEKQLTQIQNGTVTLPSNGNGEGEGSITASPSGSWILAPDADNQLSSAVLVSFTGPANLLVTRRCEVSGQDQDVLLQGSYTFNAANGVITTFIVRRADQQCDDNSQTLFSTRRLKWVEGQLFGFSLDDDEFAFSR
jgi:hypothetical protein